MHVFVTGATGLIGKAITKDLINAGHTVLGLARSDNSANELVALGAAVLRGSLQDLDILKEGAASSDGAIHVAFAHDHGDFFESCNTDQRAVQAMADGLAGSDRPLVVTSVTTLLPHGRLVTEDDSCFPTSPIFAARGQCETLAKQLASNGSRAIIMRLPPTNHGDGDHVFVARLIALARAKGVSVYLNDGQNRWPAVHYLDSAVAYRLALENGTAGSTFHAVAEQGVKMKDIAEVIGAKLGVPVVSKPSGEAEDHFGPFLGQVVTVDNPTSSFKTREALGWNPQQCGLLSDLENGAYFSS